MYTVKRTSVPATDSELFAGLASHDVEHVISSARPMEFVSGDVIHFADDPIRQVVLLTDGRVKKSQFSQSGHEVILRLAVPGEVISEFTLVAGGKHSSTAEAIRDCKALAWESLTFHAFLDCLPGLRRNVERILERRLAELNRRFWEISTKTASPRLANGLVHLLNHVGQRVDDHIEIHVSQETLGQMTAMTSSSVCRLLSKWREQGIVKVRKEIIEIHSVPQLLSLC